VAHGEKSSITYLKTRNVVSVSSLELFFLNKSFDTGLKIDNLSIFTELFYSIKNNQPALFFLLVLANLVQKERVEVQEHVD